MDCEKARQSLLDFGWSESERQRVKAILAHLDQCSDCQRAIADYHRIAALLEPMPEEDAVPPDGWASCESRMLGTVIPSRRRFTSWLLPAAALIVGASLGWAVSRHHGVAERDKVPGMAKQFTASEVAEHTAAFSKIAEVFEGKTVWMLISNVDSDMGVTDKSGSGKDLMLLRLTMSDGKKIISQADLIMLPGQVANPVVPFVNGQTLHYQVTAPAPGSRTLAVWVRVEKGEDGKEPVATLGSSLAAVGDQVLPMGQLVTPTGRYELNVALTHSTL